MDLHFTGGQPTTEEREAVDDLLGPLESDRTVEQRDLPLDERSAGRPTPHRRRHRLLPALHAVQSRVGWISPGALDYICRRLNIPPAEAYGVASFYGLFSLVPQPPVVLYLCDDIACLTQGAADLCRRVEGTLGPPGTPVVDGSAVWHRSPCLGLCERGPACLLLAAGKQPRFAVHAPCDAEQVAALMRPLDAGGNGSPCDVSLSVPQVGDSSLRLLNRIGRVRPESLDDYRAQGGYEALRHALTLRPETILRELQDSRLVGRGGAAFPTGKKWASAWRPEYLICNADESEPGTFKDRILLEGDPFALIEAMTIAAYATGCRRGLIYIRGEYPLAAQVIQQALLAARERAFLGNDIMGQGLCFDIEIHRGAGAYICGEETALFNSVEGYRGEPRSKPPFPTQAGLFGKPTIVNNVETLVNLLDVVLKSGPGFASVGTEGSTGTKLFCLSGHVSRPGVYEVPFGVTIHELIHLAGGVSGSRRLQAVLIGGAAGTFVTQGELDTPLTFEGLRSIGASLGSGAVMLFDDTVDLRRILLRIASFFRDESCGQCVPCRAGTVRQQELLRRLIAQKPLGSIEAEMILLREIGQTMRDASICGLGQTASTAVESALQRWSLIDHTPGGDPPRCDPT